MAVKRDLWNEPLSRTYTPNWHCPTCDGGYLRLVPESLHALNTAASIQARDHPAWDPDWSQHRFTALLKCNNSNCSEAASIAGAGRLEFVQTGHDTDYEEFFTPEFFKPSPNLISIPADCPPEAVSQLQQAFVASWGDSSAAANHIRVAVERLLDHIKQPQTRLSPKGKREVLSLHKRIESLAARDKSLSESLLAVKWLGNAASHSDVLTRDEIFDAMDILEVALQALFSKNGAAIKRLVKQINQRKGPAKK